MVTQTQWRVAGALCLALSALMAGAAPRVELLQRSSLAFAAYWGVFAVSLAAAVVIAFIDWRYIRLEYTVARRALFSATLGEEGYRRLLKQSMEGRKNQRNEQEPK